MDIAASLRKHLEPDRVSEDAAILAARRHDYWFASQLADHQQAGAPTPACVVLPQSLDDVVKIVNVCRDSGTALVPFGLGSGVCGGVLVDAGSVLIDMGAMNRIREVRPSDLAATFEAGVRGQDAENALTAQGLTLGHYPQSLGVSSVGGWVATRAAGQFSTGYGNIEDMVLDIEAVLPNGDVFRSRQTPRASSGPDLRQVLLGSEGTLGVITAVTLSVRRAPERRVGSAYHAPTMQEGFELQREILQRGWQPVAMRQYDSTESQRMFSPFARGSDALLVLVHEGPAERVDVETAAVNRIARERGVDAADPAAVEHWLRERNHVPSFRAFIENGVVVDTIEVASTWDRAEALYRGALEALGGVPGMLARSAHSSHAYRSGINLYFTFVAQPSDRSRMRDAYFECWERVLEATVGAGGGISHHHGIGRVRRSWIRADLGESGVRMLSAIKHAMDPTGFMNPGVLLPDE